MISMGCKRNRLIAKIFGGASVIQAVPHQINIGQRNISLAREMLKQKTIPIVSSDVGGLLGRKLKFETATGTVMIKRIKDNINNLKSSL